MTDDTRQQLDDAAMDWALGERLGGDVPPDLVERVRERRAAGPLVAAEPRSRVRAFAIAAVIVLATSVVVAIATSRPDGDQKQQAGAPEDHQQDPQPAPRQDPPKPAHVSTRAHIEALPANTRIVIATGIRDDDVPALLRLRQLEALQIWWLPIEGWGGKGLTDAGLEMFAGMSNLRSLQLHSQIHSGGAGLQVLPHLPALEEFALTVSLADDEALAVLSRIPKLSMLTLSGCTKIGKPTIERITRIPTLRSLSLNGCGHLESDWLALLGGMEQLERLDIGMIGSHTFFSGMSRIEQPEPGSGVTDKVLQAMTGMKSLRHLNLGYGAISGAGLRAIRDLPLVDLDLTGIEVNPEDLALLPPTLEVLSLRGSIVVYPDLGGELAKATPALASLDLSGSQIINGKTIAGLRALAGLQSLDLSYCPNLTAAETAVVIAELCKFEWLIALDLRGWKFLEAEQLAKIRAMPNLGRLTTDAGSELLR